LQAQAGGFAGFLWGFVDGQPVQNAWSSLADIPSRTTKSDAMSKELKRRGFAFVGSTTCYALMQAVGMVNDHVTSCFRWHDLQATAG
jgi:DNA-3-methyladenine glycosylase I